MAGYKLIVGNWKMNGLTANCAEWALSMADKLTNNRVMADIVVCMPVTLLKQFNGFEALSGPLSGIGLGGQDCHHEGSGPFTGDISAEMLHDAGCRYVIVGHSERRARHKETDEDVRKKAVAAIKAGLIPIICVGETLEQRKSGEAEAIVTDQVVASVPVDLGDHQVVVAYEPIWAIGSGLVPNSEEIAQTHAQIRTKLSELWTGSRVPILYGGSVKADNAGGILSIHGVDGVLLQRGRPRHTTASALCNAAPPRASPSSLVRIEPVIPSASSK